MMKFGLSKIFYVFHFGGGGGGGLSGMMKFVFGLNNNIF